MSHRINVGNPNVTIRSNILDVVVPKEMEKNIRTGLKHVDALFCGDGVTPSTVALLTGIPGAGKTTLALQMADSITRTGSIALYNACEESLYQVRRTVARLKFKHGFIPSYESDVMKLIALADKVRKDPANKGKQLFIFVDSLQTLELEKEPGKKGRPLQGQNMITAAVWALADWAKANYAIVILVGQVTKDGTFAGKQEIKHAVDCHLHMAIDTDRKSENYGERIAEMTKNRFGPGGIYYPFSVGAAGVEFSDG